MEERVLVVANKRWEADLDGESWVSGIHLDGVGYGSGKPMLIAPFVLAITRTARAWTPWETERASRPRLR